MPPQRQCRSVVAGYPVPGIRGRTRAAGQSLRAEVVPRARTPRKLHAHAGETGAGCWSHHEPAALKRRLSHARDAAPSGAERPSRRALTIRPAGPLADKGVTTPAPAPRARADTNAGLATVDDVCLATRHQRVSPPGRPARPRCRRRRRPAISREQGRASLRVASLRALLSGHMREDADVILRPKLPRFSRVFPPGRPARPRCRRRRRPAISREQGRASLRVASLRALLSGHMREDADVIRRPKLPRFSGSPGIDVVTVRAGLWPEQGFAGLRKFSEVARWFGTRRRPPVQAAGCSTVNSL